MVTAKLICVFVFANEKCWFSHDAAHLIATLYGNDSCFSNQTLLNLQYNGTKGARSENSDFVHCKKLALVAECDLYAQIVFFASNCGQVGRVD